MSNTSITFEQMQGIVNQTAMNVSVMSDNLGIITHTVKNVVNDVKSIKEEIGTLRNDFEAQKQLTKDRERVDQDEVDGITNTIDNRVTDILKQCNRYDLYGSFCSKCRHDARKHSYYRGRAGWGTKKMYLPELIEYIGAWTPEGWGIVGYINHLDVLRKQA